MSFCSTPPPDTACRRVPATGFEPAAIGFQRDEEVPDADLGPPRPPSDTGQQGPLSCQMFQAIADPGCTLVDQYSDV